MSKRTQSEITNEKHSNLTKAADAALSSDLRLRYRARVYLVSAIVLCCLLPNLATIGSASAFPAPNGAGQCPSTILNYVLLPSPHATQAERQAVHDGIVSLNSNNWAGNALTRINDPNAAYTVVSSCDSGLELFQQQP